MFSSRFGAFVAGLLAALSILGACSSPQKMTGGDSGRSTDERGSKSFRVAIVLPGSAADRGFNESAAEAGPALRELFGADVSIAEMTAPPDFDKTFRDFASAGFDVVIGHGFEFGDTATAVAPSYPNTYFFVTNNPVVSGPNLKGLQPLSQESAYLAGVAAGSISTSGKVAAIGGFSFPVIVTQIRAFELGVRSVRPDADVRSVYLNTFDDVERGKETALALAADGIDVMYHIADSAGIGVISGARQAGAFAIGWGKDQSEQAPGTVVTSQIVDQKAMILTAVEALRAGKLPDGVWTFGLTSGITGLAPIRTPDPEQSSRAQSRVDAATASIISGEIRLPSITEAS
jgi:basic membrane protein A